MAQSWADAVEERTKKVFRDIPITLGEAISVGEKSRVFAQNILVDNAFIGIASKDLSNISLKNLKVNNVSFCLAAYEKKKEYGPGFIKIDKSDLKCKSNYILESGSSISFKEYPLLPNTNDAYSEIYDR